MFDRTPGEIADRMDTSYDSFPKHKHMESHVDYLCLPEVYAFCLKRSVELIRELPQQPDFIACRGVSGTLIAGAVASALGISLVVIRKMDDSHCTRKGGPVGYQGSCYVIVDDFICTGSTVCVIAEALKESRLLAVCVTKPNYESNRTFTVWSRFAVPVLAVSGQYVGI